MLAKRVIQNIYSFEVRGVGHLTLTVWHEILRCFPTIRKKRFPANISSAKIYSTGAKFHIQKIVCRVLLVHSFKIILSLRSEQEQNDGIGIGTVQV